MEMPMTREEFKELVGEGIHTGLRKRCDSAQSNVAWKAINELPDWDAALEFLADGLSEMGYSFQGDEAE